MLPKNKRLKLIVAGALIMYVVAIAMIVIFVAGGPSTSTLVNRACADHNGVSRIDDGIVICRDGTAVEY